MLAAIDVGTNTIRMLIGDARHGRVSPVKYFRRITRLGGGFTVEKGLASDARERTLFALIDFASELDRYGGIVVRAVGTEALRKASNGQDFAELVRARTGIRLQVVDGAAEATLSARGVLSALAERPPKALLFDIGGGSTEFVYLVDGQPEFFRSYPLGVVRLAEDYSVNERQQAIQRVLDTFLCDLESATGVSAIGAGIPLVGTAGTVTTLAALDMGMTQYDWRRINGAVLSLECLARIGKTLEPLSPAEREKVPGMEEGRGDLIIPGLQIVMALMKSIGSDRLTVSDFGLLEGVLLELGGDR